MGDSHTNARYVERVIDYAEAAGIHHIFSVGDFGYWPNSTSGTNFLNWTSKALGTKELTFADGNHEYHDGLNHDSPSEQSIADNIWYAPRGFVWSQYGRRIMFMGGAVSVDQQWRTPGHDWFASEVPSNRQWERAIEAGKVDVVIAHDMPLGVPFIKQFPVSADLERACDQNRTGMLRVMESTKPSLWICGHYHQRITYDLGDTRVETLAHEFPLAHSVLVLDLETLTVEPINKKWTYGG